MPKKSIIAVLCAVMMTIIASVALVLVVAPRVNADSEEVELLDDSYLSIHLWYGKFVCDGLTSAGKNYVKNKKYRVVVPSSPTELIGFRDCSGLVAVEIPDNVTFIYNDAFTGCSSLTTVKFPNNVTFNGSGAFRGCTSLVTVDIPNNLVNNKIGEYMFRDCTSLSTIKIPDNVTTIGGYAFGGCSSLTSINIPEGVTTISDYAFSGCSGLTTIEIPDNVTQISKGVFYESGISSINIPEGVTSIGAHAFCYCENLTSIEIPNNVGTIGEFAFAFCNNLTTINIPSNVTKIGHDAFKNCTNLTSINISDGVTDIGNYAFESCDNLTTIEIPASVANIGDRIFIRCSKLEKIIVNTEEQYNNDNLKPYKDAGILYYAGAQTNITTTHDVTFDSNGGSAVETKTVDDNEMATRPTDPTKDHYNFAGWYLNGNAYDFTTPVTDDITLVAHWTPVPHTVTFHTNGGNNIANKTVPYGESFTVDNPVKTGCDFAGWYRDEALNQPYTLGTTITEDIELYAKWTDSKYVVTYETDGGNTIAGSIVTHGGKVTRPADPIKDGYTFDNWYLGGSNTPYDFETPVTGNITLYARWTANQTQPEDPTNPDDPNNQNGGNENNEEHNETITSPAKKNNIGMIAGIIIGAVVGLAAIIAGVATFVLKQRKKL